jgi:hypothetical protein
MNARGAFGVLLALSAVLIIGVVMAAASAQSGNTSKPVQVNATEVVEATAPSVRIINDSMSVRSGQPSNIVFSVLSPTGASLQFAIAKNGTAPSTGLIKAGTLPLPAGAFVQYPRGNSISGGQMVSFASVTVSLSGTSPSHVPLELIVSENLGSSGQAIIVVVPFVLTVSS